MCKLPSKITICLYAILKHLITITEEEKKLLDGEEQINRELYMNNSYNISNKKLLQKERCEIFKIYGKFVRFCVRNK